MPASVHKVLVHGADIVSGAILPTGQLSEEAQEYRNKNLKYFRSSHSRKISRPLANQDVFNLLLVSSDPVISSLRKLPKRATETYLPEALKLLDLPKEWEDLSRSGASCDAIPQKMILMTLAKKLLINLIESKDFYVFMCFFMKTVRNKKIVCFQ
jgi:hypothetical protein